MKELTPRQAEILAFIKSYRAEHAYSPSNRDIAAHFGMSVRGAYDHVKALCKKGYISADNRRSRSISIPEEVSSIIKIPVVGNVAAGIPLLSEENLEGYINVPESYVGRGIYFALRVKGDSMKDAGILDGDTAILVKQETAENGNIVVALLNNEAITLKRFFLEKNRVRLQSENPAYSPIYARNIKIVGKLVHIVRSYD